MTTADHCPSPVVRVSPAGSAFTTSTDVAAFFDKRHSHVLQGIEGLLCDLRDHIQWPERADQYEDQEHQPKIGLMFPEELYEAAEVEVRLGNGAIRRDPIYNLSRDGFALLAMGFTGKQALAFKPAYISAFNARPDCVSPTWFPWLKIWSSHVACASRTHSYCTSRPTRLPER